MGLGNEGAGFHVRQNILIQRAAAMDEALDEAIRALAEIQMRQGVRLIILTADEMSGDVVVSTIGPNSQKMSVYARVERGSGRMSRVLDT
jgi:hypothetical protein